uniref:Uncharacterized protein n=1 Tax=Anguilla anguilla TaxID=7936 RepID=A0A0E9SC44_ANGAN
MRAVPLTLLQALFLLIYVPDLGVSGSSS